MQRLTRYGARWRRMGDAHRLYTDLAEWWSLISTPDDYAEEAAEALRHLGSARRPVREVLELGAAGATTHAT